MSKTKVNHYVSQFIIRNFAPNNEQLYELDLKTGIIRPRSTLNLFSGRRLWEQNIEDKITCNIENDLAKVVKKLRLIPLIERKETFQTMEVFDPNDRDVLTRFILQIGLFQMKGNIIESQAFEKFLDASMNNNQQIHYVKIGKETTQFTPLILIDNAIFMDIVLVNDPKILGRICFMYPISYYEFILFASFRDVLPFLHQNNLSVHMLNMKAITNQNKECKIASANKYYLEHIRDTIDTFNLNNGQYQITSIR